LQMAATTVASYTSSTHVRLILITGKDESAR
jgi:hypothetical protein